MKLKTLPPAQLPAFLREPVKLVGVVGPDGKVAMLKREPPKAR